MTEMDGEREFGKSVRAARHHDDDNGHEFLPYNIVVDLGAQSLTEAITP